MHVHVLSWLFSRSGTTRRTAGRGRSRCCERSAEQLIRGGKRSPFPKFIGRSAVPTNTSVTNAEDRSYFATSEWESRISGEFIKSATVFAGPQSRATARLASPCDKTENRSGNPGVWEFRSLGTPERPRAWLRATVARDGVQADDRLSPPCDPYPGVTDHE